MVYAFYELAMNPTAQENLRAELDTVESIVDLEALQRLPYLEAVINETLRLHSVVPTGGIRQTADEGITVAGQYIPPHTTIVAPRYSISQRKSFEISC